MADSLDGFVENILAKGMAFPGYSEKELTRGREVFKEKVQKVRVFETVDVKARAGMKV